MPQHLRSTVAILGLLLWLPAMQPVSRAIPSPTGAWSAGGSGPAATPGDAAGVSRPQTFSAGGHALSFDDGGFHASNGSYALRVDFVGANPATPVSDGAAAGDEASSAGDEAAAAAAPPLTSVTYRDLWDGINLVYDAPALGLARSTWTVAPGADPSAIRLRYNRPVVLEQDGSLSVAFAHGELTETAPVAWQDADGRRRPVAVAFARLGSSEIGFSMGAYDPALALVIDPTLGWNTFLGGSSSDYGFGIAVDGTGNIFVAGESGATWGSPINGFAGGGDAFVAKLEPDGDLVWNTFMGSSNADSGLAIAVDGGGHVYVGGYSYASWGSPVRAYSAGSDGFSAKLDPNGNLVWNTFLGGSAGDQIEGIAVDGGGNAHVGGLSGATWGSPVRGYSGADDGFVAKLNANGGLTWNTFQGSSDIDRSQGVALDGSGNVLVTGGSFATWGSPIRAFTASPYDGFAAKLGSNGALTWNTFLGGTGEDVSEGIAVNGSGEVFVAGLSNATWGNPVRAYTANMDMTAVKLEADGDLVWNTFLGGNSFDWADGATSVALVGDGTMVVAGMSQGTWGNPWRAYTASNDGAVAKVDAGGALVWNAFLGGSGGDEVLGIAIASTGNPLVVGGSNSSWGSPVRNYSGGNDGFAAMINDPLPTPTPSITPTPSNTPTPSITPTPSNTPTPSTTPTATHTHTATATPTATPTATATPTSTPTPSLTPSATPTPTSTPWIITATPAPTDTPQPTWTPWIITATPVLTGTPTPTNSPTPTITPTPITRGDCNVDGHVDAADLTSLVLEIFDGDGDAAADAPGGSFAGNPRGCDPNGDAKVNAGDLACGPLLIFQGAGACGAP